MLTRATNFSDLPVEAHLLILEQMPLKERHRAVPLVCRSWNALVHSTPLLRHVSVRMDNQGDIEAELQISSFLEWLLRHAAPHVQHLAVSLPAEQSA
ncbi:hypothetical protein ABPG75_012669 [Micractinium tetrahymenae]